VGVLCERRLGEGAHSKERRAGRQLGASETTRGRYARYISGFKDGHFSILPIGQCWLISGALALERARPFAVALPISQLVALPSLIDLTCQPSLSRDRAQHTHRLRATEFSNPSKVAL